MRRWIVAGGAMSGALIALLAACSSFSSDDSPGSGDAASETAAMSDASSDADGSSVTCDAAATVDDPVNCGACGHSCLGGKCAGSKCLPVQIGTSSDEEVIALAVSATRVYWMTAFAPAGGPGGLYVCPKSGCAGAGVALVNTGNGGGLASDGTTAYASFVTGTRQIVRIQPNDTVTKLGLADHFDAEYLVARTEGLFVFSHGEPTGGSDRKVTLWSGTAETTVATFSPPAANIQTTEQIVVTNDHVFIGAHNDGYVAACTKVDCTTWTPLTTDATAATVASLTTDGQRLFWVSFGVVYSCPATSASCVPRQELGPAQLASATASSVTFAAVCSTSRRAWETSSPAIRRRARTL